MVTLLDAFPGKQIDFTHNFYFLYFSRYIASPDASV